MRRRLLGNIFSLYVLQGLNYAIPIAVLPYLVRVLGMERYGLIAFAQSFAQNITILTDYGFNYSATRAIARQRDDHESVARLSSAVILIKLALTLLGGAILLGVVTTVPRFHQNASFFFVAFIAVIGNFLFPVWYFQGIEKMRYISYVIGTCRLAGAIALFIFVHHADDALLALAIQSSSILAGGVAGMWILIWRLDRRFVLPSVTDLKSVLTEGWHLFVSTAAISLYTSLNVFLVGLLAGNLQAGYFSAAEKLVRALQGLIAPATQAIFPHMSALAARSRDGALLFAKRTLKWMGGVSLVSSALILALAPYIVKICFGLRASGSIPVLRWIAPLPFLIAVNGVLGVQTMVSFGLDKQFSRILISAGLLNLGLAVPLIHQYAARGAGMSVLCTEFFVVVAMLVVLQRQGFSLRGSGTVAS